LTELQYSDIYLSFYVQAYGSREKKEARDTLALPAKGFVPGPPDPVPSALPFMSGCRLTYQPFRSTINIPEFILQIDQFGEKF